MFKRPIALIVRSGLAIFALWFAYNISGQPGEGTLRVEIRERATGQVIPAMVCVTSLEDGKWRTPPDGRLVPPYSVVRDFFQSKPWKPGDIGPVRLTNGEYGDNGKRASVYAGKSSYPFWQEPAAYFVSQPFSIRLPAGKWRLAVAHGIEYVPVFEEVAIAPGEERRREIRLSRWVDMPKQGWYSGDDHVHHVRLTPEQDTFLLTWAEAEDVHVANILRMGDIKNTFFEQRGYGKDGQYRKGDYVLVSGQEDPRTDIGEQGHAIALNITAPVRDTSRYHIYDSTFDGVHAQGGLAGYAHIAWAPEFSKFYKSDRPDLIPTWDPTINVVRGKIDFFELLQFRTLGLEDYYEFLNLGFKLTASSGSDMPWGSTIGETRVYAYTGRQFTPAAWFAAVKAGHTFVTNGPMLTLTCNQAVPGDELKSARNGSIRIHARAWAPQIIGAPKSLQIVSQGRVVRSVESSSPEKKELDLTFDLRAAHSQWIVARVTSRNGALAHTSPVYVMVDGGTFASSSETPRIVESRMKVLDFIEGRLRDARFTKEYSPGEVDALQERLQQARSRYQQLLSQNHADAGK